jgi:hypothetical protein
MMHRSPPRRFPRCCAWVVLAAGCAHPAAPGGTSAANEQAAEQARRGERLKIMQEYWQEHTVADREKKPGLADAPPLEYPAGTYSGINFGPRLAPDPSLAEPNR